MSAEGGEIVRGLRAAARIAGRSPSGIQKMVDAGHLAATKEGERYAFAVTDLEAVRRDDPSVAVVPSHERASDSSRDIPTANMGAVSDGVDQVTPTPAEALPGELAARLFASFESGSAPVDVVIATKQPPALVAQAYETWGCMRAVDTTSTSAQTRIAALETAIQELRDAVQPIVEVVDVHDGSISELTTASWQHRAHIQGLSTRIAAVERGARADVRLPGIVSNLSERLTTVEHGVQTVAAWLQALAPRRS